MRNKVTEFILFRMYFLLLALLTIRAFAVCTSPAGAAGEFRFNSTTTRYEVCDGAVWTSMAAAAPSGACTGAGVISYGTAPRFCNGSLYVSMAGTDTGATCSGPALMTYNPTLKYMQYCNGTNLKSMRPAASGIAFVQHAELDTNQNGGTPITTASSGSFNGSGNVTTGNAIVCFTAFNSDTSNVVSMVATGGQNLVRGVGPTLLGPGAVYTGEIWYLTNVTGSTATKVQVTIAAPAVNVITVLCDEYSGLAATNALDQTASKSAQNNSATATAGPVTTTTAKELLYAGGGWTTVASGGTVAGSGYTKRSTTPNDMITEDRIVTAVGSYSAAIAGGANTASSYGFSLMLTLRGK